MTKRVLIFGRGLRAADKARLAEHFDVIDCEDHADPATDAFFAEALANVHGLIGTGRRWGRAELAAAPRLKAISAVSVGVDNYDVPAMSERGILLCHTPDVLTETTADTALALMLAAARRVVELANRVRAGGWTAPVGPPDYGTDIHHKRLGIVGMGRIGTAIARRARFGFGMSIGYHNRSRSPEAETELGAVYRDFDTLLAESDVVCSVLPDTPETRHRFDAATFARMPAHAVFVNVGRGRVVNENALAEALRSGGIRAAGLDVFEHEPIDAAHPLARLDNVVALPHVASATHETRAAMAQLATDNLIAALTGATPPAVYNREATTENPPRD